jgi:hypothetical protein
MTVLFDVCPPVQLSAPRQWRTRLAALLAGCCVAALPSASLPTLAQDSQRQPAARPKRAAQVASLDLVLPALTVPPAERLMSIPASAPPPPALRGSVAASVAQGAEVNAAGDVPKIAVAPSARPALVVDVPPLGLALANPAEAMAREPATAEAAEPLRPVDVVQVADSEVRSLRVPQLNEPGLVASGGLDLSARIAAMQVAPPPPARLRESDRTVLLAEAPTRLTLRIGDSTLGKVKFRMTDSRTIDVQVSGLLDLLAGHFDAAEFTRLRTSAAADAYVSFDQLRALGLNVRYDPAYDELRING